MNLLTVLYAVIGVAEVYAEITQNSTLRFFTKPLLMIVLIAYYLKGAGALNAFHKLMVAAFAFSWVGDVALMFVPASETDTFLMGITKNPNYFLVGLVGFLVTHVLYTIAFSKISESKPALLPQKFWVTTPLVIYMIVLLTLLVPGITSNPLTKDFLIPVLVYSSAIAVMVVFAINRYGRVNESSFALVFAGALLFMFSDSIIAINKFLYPFPTAGVFIMVLYITAQYLIAKGALIQSNRA